MLVNALIYLLLLSFIFTDEKYIVHYSIGKFAKCGLRLCKKRSDEKSHKNHAAQRTA